MASLLTHFAADLRNELSLSSSTFRPLSSFLDFAAFKFPGSASVVSAEQRCHTAVIATVDRPSNVSHRGTHTDMLPQLLAVFYLRQQCEG